MHKTVNAKEMGLVAVERRVVAPAMTGVQTDAGVITGAFDYEAAVSGQNGWLGCGSFRMIVDERWQERWSRSMKGWDENRSVLTEGCGG